MQDIITQDQNDRAPLFSEEHLALEFADRHAHHLRHVAGWNKWIIWYATHWRKDETNVAFSLSRRLCRELARAINSENLSRTIASAKTVAATIKLAAADQRLAATVDQWDRDPWLLNTPIGIADLRTGKMGQHDPEAYITQITSVASSDLDDCPRFMQFLGEITGGDQELESFLQRMFGYCLTGSTQEHALFFMHGSGANGKSVLINTAAGILGDYHRTSAIETFTASHSDRHPTELAWLQGRRLVTAIETEEGRRWAESRIKALTGGDRIAARFMRADFFEYLPAFKLVIAGNHKPGLRSVDEAIRRRFHLIPFNVTIPEKRRDLNLTEKLKVEWPGILGWMIRGCLEWQEQGLNPPAVVKDATAAYLEAQDAMAAWIEDECDLDVNARERSANLFNSWRTWCERNGEPYGDAKRFRERLEERGLEYSRIGHAANRGFKGVKLQMK